MTRTGGTSESVRDYFQRWINTNWCPREYFGAAGQCMLGSETKLESLIQCCLFVDNNKNVEYLESFRVPVSSTDRHSEGETHLFTSNMLLSDGTHIKQKGS